MYESPFWPNGRLGVGYSWPPHYTNDSPATNGRGLYEAIAEPLGRTTESLVDDHEGTRWWGMNSDSLPRNPKPTTDDDAETG